MDLLVDTARAAGTTVILVTHEPRVAAYADREVVVRDGRCHHPGRRPVIRLAVRLAVSGGRESIVRLVLTALGVAIGTTLLLVAAAADPAIRAHQRHTAWQYTGITGDRARPVRPRRRADPLLWSLTDDAVDGREMTVLRVAATGPDSPVPLGLSRVPGPARCTSSPALAQLLEELPADRLADRFPSAPTGTHRPTTTWPVPTTSSPPSAMTADELQGPPLTGGPPHPHRPGAVPVHGLPPHHVRRRRRRPAAAGARLRSRPRPASARRAASSASPPSASPAPRPGRPTCVAAVEAGAAAAVGAVLGVVGFLLVRPYVARIEIDGHPSFVDDVRRARRCSSPSSSLADPDAGRRGRDGEPPAAADLAAGRRPPCRPPPPDRPAARAPRRRDRRLRRVVSPPPPAAHGIGHARTGHGHLRPDDLRDRRRRAVVHRPHRPSHRSQRATSQRRSSPAAGWRTTRPPDSAPSAASSSPSSSPACSAA